MSGKHSRFLNLERNRESLPEGASPLPGAVDARVRTVGQERAETVEAPPTEGGAIDSAKARRFEALEQPGAVPATQPAGAAAGRFRRDEAPLELHDGGAEEQPFVRCARCEADNNAFAAACAQCGTLLDTPEQRAFNERLWRERREQAAAEQQALKELQQARAGAAGGVANDPRALQAMTTDLLRAEQRRYEWDLMRDGGGAGFGWGRRRSAMLDAYVLQRLLSMLPARLAQGLLAGAGIGMLVLFAIPATRPLALGVLLALGALWLRFWLMR